MRNRTGKTSYSVSATAASKDGQVFRELRFPDGSRVRIMNRQVFDRAARRANAKLVGRDAETGKLRLKG
jgi:hypothetical protein